MHPAAALDRIVYLLDRDLAEGQKVRAFARARDVVEATDDGDLARLHEAGKLTDLAGIGPTTGRVVAEALDGEVPDYLAKLEDETVIPVGEGASAAGGAAGRLPHPLDLVRRRRPDREDGPHRHRPGPRVHGADRPLAPPDGRPRPHAPSACGPSSTRSPRSTRQLAPFRILTGHRGRHPARTARSTSDEDLLARLDVVVASVHSKLRMERQDDDPRAWCTAVASPHVDILGHCTGRKLVGRGRPPSTFDAEIVFAACAQFDTAVEINCRPERLDPPDELLDLAIELGLRFAIDTDAHAPGQLEWQPYGCDKAARHGIPADRIVNTMEADDLVTWAADHAA